MPIEILESDRGFKDSPDAGHPDCICSRCGGPTYEDEFLIRAWTTNEKGEVDENSEEIRYCTKCQEAMGVHQIPAMPWDEYSDLWDPMPERVCRECGCSDNDACIHPVHGNCYWVEDDLCSHCYHFPGEATRFSILLAEAAAEGAFAD